MTITAPTRDLLRTAVIALDDAYQAQNPAQRYIASHLCALRAAAALLALRAKPARSSRVRSVWQMLPKVAPEFTEWAAYFEMIGRRRVFVEIGRDVITDRQANDLMRDAESFLDQIAATLGVGLPIPASSRWPSAG